MIPYFHDALLCVCGAFAVGAGIHLRALRGSELREQHGLLAAMCLLASAYVLVEAQSWSTESIAFFQCWERYGMFISASFLALYPLFLARSTGAGGSPVPWLFAIAAGALMTLTMVHGGGRPWLGHIHRLEHLTLPWGERVAYTEGQVSWWLLVYVPVWLFAPLYGIWRALRVRGGDSLVWPTLMLTDNLIMFAIFAHELLNIAGLIHTMRLAPLAPALLSGRIWWQLARLDRQREEFHRDLFMRAADAILVHDAADGQVVAANDSACELFAASRAALASPAGATVVPLEEIVRHARALPAGSSALYPQAVPRAGLQAMKTEVFLRTAVLEGRERIVSTWRDLTQRMRVEQGLIDNEQRLRTVISRIPLAIAEVALDGRVLALNPRCTEQLGLRSSDLRTVDAIAPPPGPGGANALQAWRDALGAALAGGGALPSFRSEADDRLGRRHRLEVCGVVTASGAVLFITDLSDILAARDELARREAFYRILVEAAADGIAVLECASDRAPVAAVWNARMVALTGVDAGRAGGAGWLEAMPDAQARAELRARIDQALGGAATPSPFELAPARSARRTCVLSARELGGGARGRRVLATLRDITDIVQAERARERIDAEVQHAQKLEGLAVLAGGLAHDFNNILMAILGRADLVLARLGPGHRACDHLRDMAAASRRSAELCQQLLAYAGRGRSSAKAVDIDALAREMVRVLSVRAPPRVGFVVGSSFPIPAVRGDANQLRQVVMNLITNAIDAIGAGGGTVHVSLSTRHVDQDDLIEAEARPEPGDYVALEVADNGCGMDAQTRRRMFDPFFTTKRHGRGLGMAATLGILKAHGGGLSITTAPGRGTTVAVFLPSHHGLRPEVTPSAGVPYAIPSATVLVVDDEDAIRATTRDMLLYLGMTVVEAATGEEGVALFARSPPSFAAVILDFNMPGIDGGETLRRMRALAPNVQAVIASGYNRDEIARAVGATPVQAFLQKPYDIDALAGALHATLVAPAGAVPAAPAGATPSAASGADGRGTGAR